MNMNIAIKVIAVAVNGFAAWLLIKEYKRLKEKELNHD